MKLSVKDLSPAAAALGAVVTAKRAGTTNTLLFLILVTQWVTW